MNTFNNTFIQLIQNNAAPFTAFDAGQTAAYNYISVQVGASNGIRLQYWTSLNSVISGYYEKMVSLPVVSGVDSGGTPFSAADFTFVVQTLMPELIAASNVAQLFSQIAGMYTEIFAVNTATQNEIIAAAQLTDSPEQQILMTFVNLGINVASSILYCVADPVKAAVACSIIAGVALTTMQGVQIGMDWSSPQPPDAFSVEVAQLWQTLINNFLLLQANLADIQKLVASDWGMLSAVNNLIVNNGPLMLNQTLINQMVTAANTAFQTSVLQVLLPVKFCIYQEYVSTNEGPSANPRFAAINGMSNNQIEWTYPNAKKFGTYTPLLYTPSKTAGSEYPYAIWWIATQEDSTAYLDSQIIYNIMNGNRDAFLGYNGWTLPIAGADYLNCIWLRIYNNTSEDLLLPDGFTFQNGPGMILSSSSTIAPQTSNTYIAGMLSGNDLGTCIATRVQTSKVNFTLQAEMNQVIVSGKPVSANYWSAPNSIWTVSAQSVSSVVNQYAGEVGGGALYVVSPTGNYPSPLVSPVLSSWSQNVGTQWGEYWVNGNSVLYALAYQYADGTVSFTGPWMEPVLINGGALAQLIVPPLPQNTEQAPAGWVLYRRFLVNGALTPVESLGFVTPSEVVQQFPNGTLQLNDQGNVPN